MWAAIPFYVGRHSADVGSCFGAVGQPRTAPQVAASWLGSMRLYPLLLHAYDLRAERFPVAFGYCRLTHFLNDVSEVLQAGDRRPTPGVEHGDIFAGTSKEDGS